MSADNRRRLTVGVCSGLAFAAVIAAPLQAAGRGGRPPAQIGTVSTVAGPGFCAGGGVLDVSAAAVRALAVDAEGRVYVDTGPPGERRIAKADAVTAALEPPIDSAKLLLQEPQARLVATGILPAKSTEDAHEDGLMLAADGAGGVLVAAASQIVRVRADEGPVVIAGHPTVASTSATHGDGGPALAARFRRIVGITTDAAGNVYLADQLDASSATAGIRFFNRSDRPITFYEGTPHETTVSPGVIQTIAGGGDADANDGTSARLVRLQGSPPALAVAGPHLYISLYKAGSKSSGPSSSIRVINLSGEPAAIHGVTVEPGAVATVAGGGRAGFGGDGGPARRAAFSRVPGMAVDAAGNLLLADEAHHRIRRIDPSGRITSMAGTGATGTADGRFNGNGRPATTARLNRPYDVKVGPQGRVYISDQFNHQVRFVDQAGIIHAALGNGLGFHWICQPAARPEATPGPARPLRGGVMGVALDDAGNAYFSAPLLAEVQVAAPMGTIETVARVPVGATGCSALTACERDGPRLHLTANPFFDPPVSMAWSRRGLYVLDPVKARVFLINRTSEPVRAHGIVVPPGAAVAVAGSGTEGTIGDGVRALAAQLHAAEITADSQGNLYLLDSSNRKVRMVSPAGTISTIFDGSQGGEEADTCCQTLRALAVDARSNLYLADNFLNRSRVWFLNRSANRVRAHGKEIAAGAVVTVAGTGTYGFGGDGGPAVEAQLESPAALAVDAHGSLYIADVIEHVVRKVDAAGIITTVAGTGTEGFNGDGLKGARTALKEPAALAINHCGNLLIADSGNDRVRQLHLAPPCASPAGVSRSQGSSGTATAVVIAATALAIPVMALLGRRFRRRHHAAVASAPAE